MITFYSKNKNQRIEKIKQLVNEWQPVYLVLGLPLNQDLSANDTTKFCINTAKDIEKNINLLNCNEKCKLLNIDCFKYFDSSKELNENFDMIFLDPPYKEKKINLLIEKILEKKILKKNGLMVIHRHKKDDIDLTKKLTIIDTRFYGISKIIVGN